MRYFYKDRAYAEVSIYASVICIRSNQESTDRLFEGAVQIVELSARSRCANIFYLDIRKHYN